MSAPDEMVEAVRKVLDDAIGQWMMGLPGVNLNAWFDRQARAVLSVPSVAEVIARASELEADLAKAIEQRDEAEEWADRLAAVAGGPEVIGEHSNMNNPWANALALLEAKGR